MYTVYLNNCTCTLCNINVLKCHLSVLKGAVFNIDNLRLKWVVQSKFKILLCPLLLRLNAHAGCQIEESQQECAQLKMERDKPYTVS